MFLDITDGDFDLLRTELECVGNHVTVPPRFVII
jgi:hypothetical protein